MHELSVCRSIVRQVEDIAALHRATGITSIRVQIGALSGVDPHLLAHAFPLASAGSIAAGAALVLETLPVRVRCRTCNTVTEAQANRLVCGGCGDWNTQLLSGDEMLLASIELESRDTSDAVQDPGC